MPKSPIKLKSSSKAKLRATKSPSNHNEQSQLVSDGSRLRSSVHTIPVKQSPHRHRNAHLNFTTQAINYAQSQPYNNVTFRSGSPVTIRESPNRNLQLSQQFSGAKSFHQMVSSHHAPSRQLIISPPKSVLYDSIVRQESVVHFMSPVKSTLDNDRSFIKVELGKRKFSNQNLITPPQVTSATNHIKIPTNQIITIRPKMISQPKIVQSVHRNQLIQPQILQQTITQVSARQIELERKVKILEMRIGELYAQKNQMETQMNETNIRLQYQNNFLKEKLQFFTSKQKQSLLNQQKQQSNQKSSTLPQQASERLIKELEKSQENEYHQSKEIHNLRQQLLQTEEMLSKEISKSLSLLEELTEKEKQNEDLKGDLKKFKEELLNAEKQLNESKIQNQAEQLQSIRCVLAEVNRKLEERECEKINLLLRVRQLEESFEASQNQNDSLLNELEEMRNKDNETKVTRELMNELEQNNQLLISAIRSLETSLRESQTQVKMLEDSKGKLEQKLQQMQDQLITNQEQTQSGYLKQVQILTSKLNQIETELDSKNQLLHNFSLTIKDQQNQIQEHCNQLQQNQIVIRNQEIRIQELMKHQEEGNSSTANSFYKKINDPCAKCDDLRKTIIKLNSHLTKSSSSIIPNPKC